MGNSSVSVQSVVDYARTFNELNPVLAAGGFSQQPALTIANDTMVAMVSKKFNWKWNRIVLPTFLTNSYQQDYAIVVGGNGGSSITNLKWLEHGVVIDVNNSAIPKPIYPLETNRDLEMTNRMYGRPGQVCWLPNDQLVYGTWGLANTPSTAITLGNNPQPFQTIVNPLGQPSQPANPILQIKDANGNLLVLTQAGTTGAVAPVLPANSAAGTTVNDGSCVWTVVDPKGQGLRINPIPSQTGLVYACYVIGQARPVAITSMDQTIDPIPDDYAVYFRNGFVAHCYRHSPEKNIRAKFQDEFNLWMGSMIEAIGSGDRERENAGFYPTKGIMDNPFNAYIGPANPYAPGW